MEKYEKKPPQPILKECSKCNRKGIVNINTEKCKFCQVNTLEVCK